LINIKNISSIKEPGARPGPLVGGVKKKKKENIEKISLFGNIIK